MDITDEQIKGLLKAILFKTNKELFKELDPVFSKNPKESERFMEEMVWTVRHYLQIKE